MKCRVSFPKLLVFLSLLTLRTAAQPTSDHPQPLAFEQTINREIKFGESHWYQLNVTRGQMLEIEFSSSQMLLSVSIRGEADTSLVSEKTLKLPAAGRLLFLPDKSGEQLMTVSCDGKKVQQGQFSLRVKVKAQPTSDEFAMAAGQRQLTQLWPLYYQDTAESLQQAIALGEERLKVWRRLQDPFQTAKTLYFLGEAYKSKEQFPAAIDAFQQALTYFQAENIPHSQAIILTSLGQIHASRSDYTQAISYYQQALPLWDQGDGATQLNMIGWNLVNFGHAYRAYGEWAKAQEYYEQAEACFEKYPPHATPTERPRGLGIVQASLGIIALAQGDKQAALAHLKKAVQYFQQGENPENEFAMYGRIGEVYASLGEYEQAQRSYEQALKYYGKTELLGEATILNSYGNLHRLTGNYSMAVEKLQQALTIRQQRSDRRGQAMSLTNLGALFAAQQQPQQALAAYTEAQTLWQDIGDKYSQGYTLNYLGLAHYDLKEAAQARSFFQQALSLRRATNDREGEANTLYNLARLDYDAGKLVAARDTIASAVTLSEAVRATVASDDLRASYLATVREYYEFYIQVLMQLHRQNPSANHHAEAFAVSEMARARSLLDSLTAQQLPAQPDSESKLLTQERALQQRLNAKAEYKRTLQRQNTSAGLQQAAEQEIQTLIADIKEIRHQRQATQPHLEGLAHFVPLAVTALQKTMLDKNTALLAYSVGKDRSYLWYVSADEFASYELPSSGVIEAAARAAYEQLRPRKLSDDTTSPDEVLAALSRIVLAPVAYKLKAQRLLIVADGALQYVPFAALPKPNDEGGTRKEERNGIHRSSFIAHPLIVDHELITLPSATFLRTIRQAAQRRTAPPRTIAVFADPVFDSADSRVISRASSAAQKAFSKLPDLKQALRDVGANELPRLPFTLREAEAITALVPAPQRKTALNFAASRATFLQTDWREYGIVHIATHGLLNSTHPELSGLVLSLVDQTGAAQAGFLRLHEIYNLRLNADLVVLSACQTGLGKEIRGEGLIGLTRGFLHAGSSRVVASLWKVSDKATAELMKVFYRELLGKKKQSAAAALRAAQLSLWQQKRWRHPTYWAAFTLQGEWQ